MVALREQRDVGDMLAHLAATLETLEFGPDAASLAAERDRLAGIIRNYLVPRTIDPARPTTVVIAGPTGSGKSTLVNSLTDIDASRTGALRPTTRTPVVVTARDRIDEFSAVGGVPCEVVAGIAPILESMVLVDTPDIDSTSTGHRATAETLLDNADVVVFVTSALRYADDVPWQVLRRAVSRGAPVIHVLNRVGSGSAGAMIDFRSKLSAAGFDDDLITVPEHHLARGSQRVPSLAVRSLQNRLGEIRDNRDRFGKEVLRRVLSATVSQVIALADAMSAIGDDVDGLEAELSVDLAGRVARLPLADLGKNLFPPPPRSSRIAVRRWRKRAGGTETSIGEAESVVIERTVALVTSDVRRWLAEQRPMLRDRDIDPAPVIAGVGAGARSAAQGWVSYVARIVAEHDSSDSGLGRLVLIDAAVVDDGDGPAQMLFGEESPVLIDRARRELIGRLEMIYELSGSLVVEGMRESFGDLDDTDLRSALGAVTSILAPVYA